MNVACIKTDTQFVRIYYSFVYFLQFLKGTSNFASLSGHCFQSNHYRAVSGQYLIQSLNDLVDSGFDTGAYVRAGMENQNSPPHCLCPL